jgi:hypothetical protein
VLAWLRRRIPQPEIRSHLLRDEGEVIVDEVPHHWIVYTLPVLEVLGAVVVFALFLASPLTVAWLPFLICGSILAHAGYKSLKEHMDRFVVTNMRVFRVNGVFTRQLATMPLARILDISVVKPLSGRILGYGHFTFENAAQEQGLREIRFVGHPDELDLAIQRVVQRAGLRGPRVN